MEHFEIIILEYLPECVIDLTRKIISVLIIVVCFNMNYIFATNFMIKNLTASHKNFVEFASKNSPQYFNFNLEFYLFKKLVILCSMKKILEC